MISVLIMTRNEERALADCLRSVDWCDDVHVLDSYSTDQTVSIARSARARVTQRRFDNWAAHQNWAVANIDFRYPWVLWLDADERATPEIEVCSKRAVANPGPNVAFRVERRDYLGGRWLQHVQASRYYVRLFRPDKMHFERLVNPVSVASGMVGKVEGHINHFPFDRGISHWLDRHNSYSTLEAQEISQSERASLLTYCQLVAQAIRSPDFHERRRKQKQLFYKMPLRPLLKFFLLYVAKGGFLDGRAGLTYAILQSYYEYMIVLKTRERLKISETCNAEGVATPCNGQS